MSPDRYDRGSSRRGVWSHWVPLAITLTVATAGVAAWIWSQRKEDEEDNEHEPGLDYENADYGDNPPYGASQRDSRGPQQPPRLYQQGDDAASYGVATAPSDVSAGGWGARMSGALRRTPSPQHFFDSTGKTVAAGMAAAGAAVGKALASIREEDKAYGENPWQEEADAKKGRAPATGEKSRKTVAIVVSADTKISDISDDGTHELASILSHIPRHNDFSKIKLYILIYAPDLKEPMLDGTSSNLPPPSLSSSFSNIGHDQAQTPGEETKSPLIAPSNTNAAYDAVYSQALSLVDKETTILPFTTPNGHVHILRHIQPDILYLQESLSGDNGSIITTLQTWLRHDIILVVGAESGSGGLADSESEAEKTGKQVEKWWQRPERVGRGRGVVVVDGMRVHDDWARRVQGRE
ncbi:peroxin 22-like protein [Metarhizium brunneum]